MQQQEPSPIPSEVNDSPVNPLHLHEEGRDSQGRWQPGQSGNPGGKAPGTRNRVTVLAEALLDGEAEQLMRTVIAKALYDQDRLALRLCLERLVAPRKIERVKFAMPPLETAADATKALAAVAEATAAGELSAAEASHLGSLVRAFLHATEIYDFDQRLTAVEIKEGLREPADR